jgi:hypothetical protein
MSHITLGNQKAIVMVALTKLKNISHDSSKMLLQIKEARVFRRPKGDEGDECCIHYSVVVKDGCILQYCIKSYTLRCIYILSTCVETLVHMVY